MQPIDALTLNTYTKNADGTYTDPATGNVYDANGNLMSGTSTDGTKPCGCKGKKGEQNEVATHMRTIGILSIIVLALVGIYLGKKVFGA
jgi:hypothetical protein